MRPDCVSMLPPLDQHLSLVRRRELLALQQFIAELGVKALAVAVLPRTAQLYIQLYIECLYADPAEPPPKRSWRRTQGRCLSGYARVGHSGPSVWQDERLRRSAPPRRRELSALAAALRAAILRPHMCDAPIWEEASAHDPRTPASGKGSEFSRQRFLQDQLVERELRDRLLEPLVLAFQLLEPLRLIHLQAAVLTRHT